MTHIVNSKSIPVMGLKKKKWQIDSGILPHVSFYYQRLGELPVISFANVGYTPQKNGIGLLTSKIKHLCGYGWANGIEGVHYYDGSRWSYPFHVHVFFDRFLDKRRCGAQLPDVKSATKYEFALYAPLNGLPILSFEDRLKSWNARMTKERIEQVGAIIHKYESEVMKECMAVVNDRQKTFEAIPVSSKP